MSTDNPLIVALDTDDLARLEHLSASLGDEVGLLKVGLQAFVAHGPAAVRAAAVHAPVFADLKLSDIPNTMAGAAAAAADHPGVDLLTVHATSGPAGIAAAVKAAPDLRILAVTVLTSLDDATLAAMGHPSVDRQVTRLGRMAIEAGAAGLVCAAGDVAALRQEIGAGPLLVVPGIRPEGSAAGDQARTATPRAALAAGASHLVVGRPITTAADPVAAARAILTEARATSTAGGTP